MVDPNSNAERGHWSQTLGDGARDVLADLTGQAGRADAEHALKLLAHAMGEDPAAPELDPGLPQDYTIYEQIGRGASGVVYRAKQENLGREVAVKVLRPGGDARETERLLGEARRLAALVHPGIVAVYEVGRATSGVYVTLELQSGGSLQALLADGPLNPARAARLVRQSAEALAYIHSRGVVHLDLKPGNVLLDAEGNARVADFGLAREIASMELSASSGGILGTPAFMAPEQAADRREDLGEHTDVYGLGALLYACLAGAAPFPGRSLLSTLQAVRSKEPTALERIAPRTPPDLIAITNKAMAKRPGDRYPNAKAMAQDLGRFESGKPVQARLPGMLVRTGRLLKRNAREIAIAVGASVLALLSVIPFQREGMDADEVRLWAAADLLQAGNSNAALLLLDRVEDAEDFAEDRAAWFQRLQKQASPDPEQAESSRHGSPSYTVQSAEKLGLAPGDWDWIVARYGTGWLQARVTWLKSPFDIERAWQDLIVELAKNFDTLDPEDRARVLAVADLAPQWNWAGGFEGWLSSKPADARELLALAAKRDLMVPEPIDYSVLIDVFIVDGEGNSTLIGSQKKLGGPGERVRIEGKGSSKMSLPQEHVGIDLLHLSSSGMTSLGIGKVRYEVEGVFEAMAGGVMWSINDRETDLGIGKRHGSWFLKRSSDGLKVGSAALLEAHRYNWQGEGAATILMLGEIVEAETLETDQQERSLSDWAQRLTKHLESELATPFDQPAWERLPPLTRATFLDLVEALAVVGPDPARDALDLIATRLEVAAIEPAALSDEFTERGTFVGVTGAGADFGFWLNAARRAPSEIEPHTYSGVGATLDRLPKPGSASASTVRGFEGLTWFNSSYVIAGLLAVILASRLRSDDPRRLPLVGWSLILAFQGLDKVIPLSIGPLSYGVYRWDAIALGIMAWASYHLIVSVGSWAHIASAALAIASVQELCDVFLHLNFPRLPLAFALIALAHVAARLDPWKKFGWLPYFASALFGFLGCMGVIGIGSHSLSRTLIVMSVAGSFIVLFSLAMASSYVNRSELGSNQ